MGWASLVTPPMLQRDSPRSSLPISNSPPGIQTIPSGAGLDGAFRSGTSFSDRAMLNASTATPMTTATSAPHFHRVGGWDDARLAVGRLVVMLVFVSAADEVVHLPLSVAAAWRLWTGRV